VHYLKKLLTGIDTTNYTYLCKTNRLQMKKILLIALLISLSMTSCGDDDNKIHPINGTWYTFETSVNLTSESKSADAAYLQERINVYYAAQVETEIVTKEFTDEMLTTITALKETPNTAITKTESSYNISGDTITINDKVYGAVKYGYIISNEVLTLYGTVNQKRVSDMADQLGILLPVPSDIKGTIKIKDKR